MPDLKNKYTDSELNPVNKDFEELVNRPDMKAFDDQGDAIARDLKKQEGDLEMPDTFGEGDGKDAARRAEAKAWNAPENRFGYKAPGQGDAKPTASVRRKNGIKLGIGGGVIGIVLFLAGSLLPLKITGIMQMIADEAGQRVEQITEKRAKMLVGRYILSHAAPGVVLTGKGPVSTLMASMRTSNFEKRLAAKGIVIEGSGKNTVVKVRKEVIFTMGDQDIEKGTITLVKNLDGSKVGRQALSDVIKEEIPSWRWMKRAKFAKWLRIKYGIPRYGLENSKNPDENERVKDMQKARLTPEYEAQATTMGAAGECIVGDECDTDPYKNNASGDGITEPHNNPIDESAREAIPETVEANSDPVKGLRTTLMKTLVGKIGSKAIPIVGWIDLVVTIDHYAYETAKNDYFGKLAALYRSQQYSRHYGVWSGYASQIQLGALDPSFISVLAKQTEGIEESQAFNMIEGFPDRGKKVVNKINQNNPSEISKKFGEWTSVVGGYDSLAGKAAHWILDIWWKTVGRFFRWAAESVGSLVAKILGILPDVLTEWATKLITTVMSKLLEIMGLDFDPAIKGADWFNATHGGATWTSNDFCKSELGCRKLTSAQTTLQNSTIAAERAEYRSDKGLFYALFDTQSSTSVTTQLAVHTPTNAASMASSVARMISDTPARLLGLMTGKTSATSYVDIHGVDPYGALASELDKPIDGKAIRGEPCDEGDGKSLNLCKTDGQVAEAMLCEFTPEIEGCAEGDPEASTSEGVEFTVGSYNILHSDNHADKSRAIGGCNRNPVPGDPNCAKTRAALQAKVIKGEVGGIPTFDIFGTQEMSPDQYNIFKETLTDYDAFPENPSRMSNQLDGAVAIFWNTTKFSKFASGKFDSLSNVITGSNGGKITNPWVGLQSVTGGHKVYVTSVHLSLPQYGGTPEKMRESAEKISAWVKSEVAPDSTVVVVGDMNDKLSEKLTYCVFTRNGLLQHARDMMDGLDASKECPNPTNDRASIDHIYGTPSPAGITVTKWADPPMTLDPILTRASDHTPVYATYKIPGSESTLFNVASFNIYHSDDPQWQARLRRSVKTLEDYNVDIAGLQEVRPDQNRLFRTAEYGGNTYDMFPSALDNPEFSPNPIIWNKSKFKLIKTGGVPFTYFCGMNDKAPLVKLESLETGQQFYVVNTHDPADVGDRRGCPLGTPLATKMRYENAKSYAVYFKDLAKEGLPIFFTGDFNSGYEVSRAGNDTYEYKRENLTYCIMTDNTGLWDSYDAEANKTGKCPTTNYNPSTPAPGIDHIFLSTNVKVSKYSLAPKGTQNNGSDAHATVVASVEIPGEDTASGAAGDWQWPVDKKWWQSDRGDFLGGHIGTGTAWGADNMGTNDKGAGIAADIGIPPDGSPVYAMLGGVVTSTNLCGAGDGIAIKTKLGNATVGIAYMHGTNKQFHVGDTVKAGDHIMNIGVIGCNVNGGHVHIGIAYNGKYVCPQDVFLAMGSGKSPDLASLVGKAKAPCSRL